MPTSPFFNNFAQSQEQGLIEDLVVESIRIHGIDTFYIPRSYLNVDGVFSEDELAAFNAAYMVEMYIKNIDGMQGEGDFLSKFGVEIRDSITFTIARRAFAAEVTHEDTTLVRPREGDLVWFPLTQKLYSIKFVEHEAIFYQMGALQTYDLSCELFEYNNESFDTGIPEIDARYVPLESDIGDTDPDDVILSDPLSQNQEFKETKNDVIDFTESNPFGEP